MQYSTVLKWTSQRSSLRTTSLFLRFRKRKRGTRSKQCPSFSPFVALGREMNRLFDDTFRDLGCFNPARLGSQAFGCRPAKSASGIAAF